MSDDAYEQIVPPAEKALVGIPARTAEDALAAFDYLRKKELSDKFGGTYEQMVESLLDAIRGYIASTA